MLAATIAWVGRTKSYGEFLAVLYLKDKRVPARTIPQALTHPTGGLIPQLAVVAAWTTSLSAELRMSLIAADPWALLHGDVSNWEAPDLAFLTRSMLDHVEQGRFHARTGGSRGDLFSGAEVAATE